MLTVRQSIVELFDAPKGVLLLLKQHFRYDGWIRVEDPTIQDRQIVALKNIPDVASGSTRCKVGSLNRERTCASSDGDACVDRLRCAADADAEVGSCRFPGLPSTTAM